MPLSDLSRFNHQNNLNIAILPKKVAYSPINTGLSSFYFYSIQE